MITKKDLKPLYQQIYDLALPYYRRGREAEDIHHLVVTEIMMNLLKKTILDEEIMLATSLLHDIGYATIAHDKKKDYGGRQQQYLPERIVKEHMTSGAKIAKKILFQLDFPKNKINDVCEIIATHDNPKLGLPLKTKEQKLLREADNLWMTTEEAFWIDVKRRSGVTAQDWLSILEVRFTQEEAYTDYLTTHYAKQRVNRFFAEMKVKLSQRKYHS